MFRLPGNIRETIHRPLKGVDGWVVVVPIININSERFHSYLATNVIAGIVVPKKTSMYHLHANVSRIFLIILSESSFKVISKNTVPQIYFQKLTPKCQHFVTFVGSTSWKSSEVIRSGEQNSWKAQIFSILFFGPQKLSQDLNDEPGMQWTFTFSTPEKSHLSNW